MPRQNFKEKSIPHWNCPCCSSASLKLKENSFSSEFARGDIDDPDFDLEYAGLIFNMMLKCANGDCKAHVSCSGTGHVTQEYFEDGSGNHGYFSYYSAKYFEPPLMLLDIPADTPVVVIKSLKKSFSLYFSNPPTALSCLRTTMEVLLSELGVPEKNANDKPIHLATRIDQITDEYKEMIEPAKAIKWLGNDGTHAGSEATKDNALEGYKIFETILHKLYPSTRPDINDLVTRINDAKGPKSQN